MDFDSWPISYTKFGTVLFLNQIFTISKYTSLRRYDTRYGIQNNELMSVVGSILTWFIKTSLTAWY